MHGAVGSVRCFFPAQVYRASVKPENRGHSSRGGLSPAGDGPLRKNVPYFPALPAFPCTSGTEAPFVQTNRKGRCRLGPTPVLRRPTWAGKKDRTSPTEAAGNLTGRCSPCMSWCAPSRHRAGRWCSRFAGGARRAWAGSAGALSAGPCRTPQRERRIEATPSYPLGRRKWRLDPVRARQRRKAAEEMGHSLPGGPSPAGDSPPGRECPLFPQQLFEAR